MYDKCYQSRQLYDVTNRFLLFIAVLLCALTVPVMPLFPFNNHTTEGETSKVDILWRMKLHMQS